MKYLLIDDLAEKGWKSVIEKAIIRDLGTLDYTLNYDDAIKLINNKYDLIFLDVRLTENDHKINDVTQYSGFKLLQEIKKDFRSMNFCTPIILITASNKIWNIDLFTQYGVDNFYIKEHPNYIFNKEFSKQNLNNLQQNFLKLNDEGIKRTKVWDLCIQIFILINNHKYFNAKAIDRNVKARIIDKLKLGYAQIFSKQTEIQKNILQFNSDSLSFIIFWSILEEISKGFTDINNTWYYNNKDKSYEFLGNWTFKNGQKFIEKLSDTECKVNYIHHNKIQIKLSDNQFLTGRVKLSDQIYALIFAYIKDSSRNTYFIKFKNLNNFRNNIDYIHSSIGNILTKELIIQDSDETYKMNIKILVFIKDLLSNQI